MSVRLGMVVDAGRCVDCKACMASCKVANQVPKGFFRNWIKEADVENLAVLRKKTVFQPGGCMQCDKPTCVTACPTGATFKDPKDGVVRIDRELCIGCGQCLPACPYGARYRHPELRVADKCDFCEDRRAQGLEPACVSTCPTKARVFGDLNDPAGAAGKLLREQVTVQVENQVTPTDPNMYYLGDPGPYDWPKAAEMPGAYEFWKNLAGPAVKIFSGLMGLGVAAMLIRQIMLPGDAPEDQHEKGGSDE